MDNTQINLINKELELFSLKNKLLISLKYYLLNTQQTELSCFNRILELLKQKYTNADDFNFVEQGIRCNIQNNTISNMSSHIYNCKNKKIASLIME